MVIVEPGVPSWVDIVTACATVGAVVAAVGIALWTERRSDNRVREERRLSGVALADLRALDKTALDDERAHARAQLEEERRLASEGEQRQLYTVLLLSIEALNRAIKTPLAADPELRAGTVSDAIGIAVGNVNRSYYAVYLAGSPDILPLAEAAWQAAWHLHDWAEASHPDSTQAVVELEILRRRLTAAEETFAEAVRRETAN